jgi:hypothetical protein
MSENKGILTVSTVQVPVVKRSDTRKVEYRVPGCGEVMEVPTRGGEWRAALDSTSQPPFSLPASHSAG